MLRIKNRHLTLKMRYTKEANSYVQNKPAAEYIRETSSKTTESLLMERLLLIHNKTDLKIRKDNLHLISVSTLSFFSSVLFVIFLSNMLAEHGSLSTFTTYQRKKNNWVKVPCSTFIIVPL